VDWEDGKPKKDILKWEEEESRIASCLWMARIRKQQQGRKEDEENDLEWLSYTIDALKLATGTKYLPQVNFFLSEHLRHSSMEYLIGPLLRIGLLVSAN